MAGHSQFKNIMHRKGRQDAARSKLFAKLAREITVAAKTGVPDPDMNPRLRLAMQAARAENMPKDNIERAIKKAAGARRRELRDVRYEGYGPGGVAVIVEALTDNRNRTGGAVRAAFTKYGGDLGETGPSRTCSRTSARSSIRPRPAPPTRCSRPRSRPAPTMSSRTPMGTSITCAFEDLGAFAGARGQARRAGVRKAVWKPTQTTAVDEEKAADDHEADRRARGRRRRAERVSPISRSPTPCWPS